jgi:myo-inositol-1(or 4)-monophosphatase
LPAVDFDAPLAEIADSLARAVVEAGALALASFGAPIKNWTKANNSPVCDADIAVDRFLRERLMGEAPHYGWLSEESVDDPRRLSARRLWVVDPIDGTRAFLAGRSDWSICAALVEDGRPVAAAINVPRAGETFVAVKGGGARLNGRLLRIRDGAGLAGARVAGPRRLLERFTELRPGIAPLPKVHSLALRIASVAADTIDIAFASANSRDWDLAAADLIVHEAGGRLTDFSGDPVRFNRAEPVHGALLAGGRGRHAIALAVVRDHGLS